jgi:hypothetical protein
MARMEGEIQVVAGDMTLVVVEQALRILVTVKCAEQSSRLTRVSIRVIVARTRTRQKPHGGRVEE